MKRLLVILFLAVFGLMSWQCSDNEPPRNPGGPDDPDDPPVMGPGDISRVDQGLIDAVNRFSLKIFKAVEAQEAAGSNIFISPLSMSLALGMTSNGAKGETKQSMKSVLEIADLSDSVINESYYNLTDFLVNLDPTVIFEIGNSIWYMDGYTVDTDFYNISRDYFDAGIYPIDFCASWAADTINHWVDVKTHGKITEIIKPPLGLDIVVMLLNAIYFKGTWTYQFDPEETFDGKFFLEDGTIVDCRMMLRQDSVMYYEDGLLKAVDLPYGDGAFAMAVIMPKYNVAMDEVVEVLTPESWSLMMPHFVLTEIPLAMPRFKFEYSIPLNEILMDMGMAVAFAPGMADFSRMFVDINFWIDKVLQKTFVQVDESGTEAAAVTIVVGTLGPSPHMTVNRPFLFVIHERESNSIQFIGKVANPVWED